MIAEPSDCFTVEIFLKNLLPAFQTWRILRLLFHGRNGKRKAANDRKLHRIILKLTATQARIRTHKNVIVEVLRLVGLLLFSARATGKEQGEALPEVVVMQP